MKTISKSLSGGWTNAEDSIYNIDLSSIKNRVMAKTAWDVDRVTEVEEEYRRFLWLKRRYVDEKIVPTKEVDLFWHEHLLDTRKYADHCTLIFGHFLHHSPSDNPTDLIGLFDRTCLLYETEFGKNHSWRAHSKGATCCGSDCH